MEGPLAVGSFSDAQDAESITRDAKSAMATIVAMIGPSRFEAAARD